MLYFISSIVVIIQVSPEGLSMLCDASLRQSGGTNVFFYSTVVSGDATSLIAMIQ